MQISNSTDNRKYRIAVSVFFFVAGFTFSTWAIRIPDIKTRLGLNEASLGTILFALPVGQILSLPFSGWFITRYGSRKLLTISAFLYPVSLLPLALAISSVYLVIALFFFGFLANIINIAMNTQAVGVERLYGRSIMASFHGLWSLAGFGGAAAGSLFITAGFTPLTHFTIVICLMVLPTLIFYKKTLTTDARVNNRQIIFGKPDKTIWVLGSIAFCCLMCEGAIADWSGVYYQQVIATPVSLIAVGYVAFAATMAGGRFLGDRLITKFGVNRILSSGANLIVAGLLLVVLLPNVITATIGLLMVGLGASCIIPMIFTLAGKSKKMSASLALTTVSTIGFLGLLAGPPLLGFVAQAVGMRWAFGLLVVMGIAIVGLSRLIKTCQRPDAHFTVRKKIRAFSREKYPSETLVSEN